MKSDRVENSDDLNVKNAEGEQVKKRPRGEEKKMEKSSLNIKSFRNLLSSQSRSYKIAPNGYIPTEVKLNGLSATRDESSNSRNIDEVYAVKINNTGEEQQRNFADVLRNVVGNYNSSFCLTVLTPVACR